MMKVMKSMALMAMGAGALLAYQKYEKPMIKQMDKTMKKAVRKTNKALDDMV